MPKVLVIRFSSFGDIAQAMPAAQLLAEQFPNSEIHWLTRQDFAEFVKTLPSLRKIWSLNPTTGFLGLIRICQELAREDFSHIYDSHNNLRSLFVRLYLRLKNPSCQIALRSKNRLRRFLLFQLRWNFFEKPFRGTRSFIQPLKKWGISADSWPVNLQLQPKPPRSLTDSEIAEAIVLAPSATWDLKKWPTSHWQNLVRILSKEKFMILAGPNDTFCQEIAAVDPQRIRDLSGVLSWSESTYVVQKCKAVVSADTGLLHVADIHNKKTLALIGPTAFGYPSRPNTITLEVPLNCRPCTKDGRGRCTNPEFKKCMSDIHPADVAQQLATQHE